MGIKLFVTDMDGTLLDSNRRISDVNREKIRQAVKDGMLFTVATGRMYKSALPYAESLERLAALFYHCRAQAGERVTDEHILEFLSTRFEGVCGGDFERLEELEQSGGTEYQDH